MSSCWCVSYPFWCFLLTSGYVRWRFRFLTHSLPSLQMCLHHSWRLKWHLYLHYITLCKLWPLVHQAVYHDCFLSWTFSSSVNDYLVLSVSRFLCKYLIFHPTTSQYSFPRWHSHQMINQFLLIPGSLHFLAPVLTGCFLGLLLSF